MLSILSQAGGSQHSNEPGSGLLSRWLSSHYHGGVHDEKSVTQHTVNLLTATIKLDADQSDLRFCFRIISPTKNYTLQVQNQRLDQKYKFGFSFMFLDYTYMNLSIISPNTCPVLMLGIMSVPRADSLNFILTLECRQRMHWIKWTGLKR